jgi:hypothetical protein
MKRPPRPGFWLVVRRELRWLLHDRTALILIFGVPLFACVVLTAAFSNPVIRGLGVVVVDADRSDTSRAFVEEVASSPGLSIVERADFGSSRRDLFGGGYFPRRALSSSVMQASRQAAAIARPRGPLGVSKT